MDTLHSVQLVELSIEIFILNSALNILLEFNNLIGN